MPPLNEVRESLGHIKRSTEAGYDGSWDTWLLPRVTGHHTGTTDENIQWAACKWGISDDLIRAIALRESGWYQYEVYPNGRCVLKSGCGDVFPSPGPATRRYCAMVASYGPDYQTYLGRGHCPKTFSIVGVMSWQDPTWGPMPGNQNGTFPFNRDSTAFALDYLGSFLRGCQEGWVLWLGHGGSGYGPGRLWGCVGVWYAGAWDSPEARHYVSLVKAAMSQHPWLAPDWADERLPCSAHHGCPRGVT